ncbi:MAG: hypothetical protein R2860_01395 [Desulfobacterales bacterium]
MKISTKCHIIFLLLTIFLFAVSVDSIRRRLSQAKGNSYHRFAANFYYADEEFDKDGDSRSMADNGDFTEYSFNYYGEFGILDTLTVLGLCITRILNGTMIL